MKLRHQGLEQERRAAIMPAKQLVLRRRKFVAGAASPEDVSVNSQGASPLLPTRDTANQSIVAHSLQNGCGLGNLMRNPH